MRGFEGPDNDEFSAKGTLEDQGLVALKDRGKRRVNQLSEVLVKCGGSEVRCDGRGGA